MRVWPMRAWPGRAAGALLATLPAAASATTQGASFSVSAFVSDNPGTCHAWPSAGESGAGSAETMVNVRCTGPAPYSISLARAVSAAPETGEAAPAPPQTAAPQAGERRVSAAGCDGELKDCVTMQASTGVKDTSVIRVTVLY